MISRRLGGGLLVLLASTQGCLASKNDIRLLQDELRVSRAAEAHADSARAAQGDSIRRLILEDERQLDDLFATAMQSSRTTGDSLAVLSLRLLDFSANTRETLDQLGKNVIAGIQTNQATNNQIGALNRQWEDLQQKVSAGAAAAPAPAVSAGVPGDTSGRTSHPSDIPPPAHLMEDARSALSTGACGTARQAYTDFLTYYPTNDQAAYAQSAIAQTFKCEGNSAAADSVYQVVTTKYPGTDQAGIALFQHFHVLCTAKKSTAARTVLQKIKSDYTTSTVYPDAVRLLGQSDPCK